MDFNPQLQKTTVQTEPRAAPTVAALEAELRRLANRVGVQFEMPRHDVALAEIAQAKPPAWRWAKGIYVFETDGIVQYVGRALGNGMWDRVRRHLTLGDEAWRDVVKHPRTRLRLYIFDLADIFWSASFEIRLIDVLKPAHNRRVG